MSTDARPHPPTMVEPLHAHRKYVPVSMGRDSGVHVHLGGGSDAGYAHEPRSRGKVGVPDSLNAKFVFPSRLPHFRISRRARRKRVWLPASSFSDVRKDVTNVVGIKGFSWETTKAISARDML